MVSYTVSKLSSTSFITYPDVKDHLNLTHDYHQNLVQSYLDAAVVMAENYTDRSLNVYDITATSKNFIQNLNLEYTPVKQDFKVEYYDAANALKTLVATNYSVLNIKGELYLCYNDLTALPAVYDRVDAVIITYQAGETAANVPEAYTQFVKLCVTFLFENRSDSVDKLPRFMYSLLRPYKKWN